MKGYDAFRETPIPIPEVDWSWAESKQKKILECNEKLVPLSLAPDKLIVSPQYLIQGIKGAMAECFVRETVHAKLIEAAKLLLPDYKLVVYDCWRPLKVQQALFDKLKSDIENDHPSMTVEEVHNEALHYVALPSKDVLKPSPHNTGGAVDVTIADENGLPLDMGTEFDDPSMETRTAFYERKLAKGLKLTPEETEFLKNRRFLYNVMITVGFTNYTDEWLHYDYGNQNWAWMTGNDHAIYGKITPKLQWNKELE